MGGHWNCALQTSDSLSRICTPSSASLASREVLPALLLLVLLVLSTGAAATGSATTGSALTGTLMISLYTTPQAGASQANRHARALGFRQQCQPGTAPAARIFTARTSASRTGPKAALTV